MSYQDQKSESQQEYFGLTSQSGARNYIPLPEGPLGQAAEARHLAGQVAMRDPRAAQLLALFEMSDERGRVTLLAIAGIHAARFPKEK